MLGWLRLGWKVQKLLKLDVIMLPVILEQLVWYLLFGSLQHIRFVDHVVLVTLF